MCPREAHQNCWAVCIRSEEAADREVKSFRQGRGFLTSVILAKLHELNTCHFGYTTGIFILHVNE